MKVLLTGSSGMLGKAIQAKNAQADTGLQLYCFDRKEYDLTKQVEVDALFSDNKFDAVIHAAAKVGGIQANINDPVGFLSENVMINTNIIYSAFKQNVDKLMFIGSSCMYPKDYTTPLKETFLLQAPLEPTNEGYALSKIFGAKLCEYISEAYKKRYCTVIPCNLYGPNDHFSEVSSHLIASAILKITKAKQNNVRVVDVWGDGKAAREFMYVEDLADFIITMLPQLEALPNYINVGPGQDHTVNEYYQMIASAIGHEVEMLHDISKPAGMQRKLLDTTLLKKLNWAPTTDIRAGIKHTVNWYNKNYDILSTCN